MKNLTRRTFLGYSLGALGFAALAGCGDSAETFFAPPVAPPSQNGIVDVRLRAGLSENFLAGKRALTTTYNGSVPGPTIRARPGDELRVLLVNDLPKTPAQNSNVPNGPYITNLHVHGLHVSPLAPSDDVFIEIPPGEEYQYIYHIPADHPPGTFWYHPHRHGSVANQMWGGMGGALIIEGGLDTVPEIQQARDLVFLIQEIRVDAQGIQPDYTVQFIDYLRNAPPIYTVNGATTPTIVAQPGEVVRLRVIHGGVGDYVKLGVDGHDLHVLAHDGISCARVETEESVVLAPANRVEVLVKAGQPGTYSIRKQPFDQGFGLSEDLVLAHLVVAGEPVDMALPTALPAPLAPITDEELTGRRSLTFEVGPPDDIFPVVTFGIDGQPFDENRVDQSVDLGSVEEWTLYNTSDENHPFHIHVNPFQVMQIGDTVLDRPLWKDTVDIPPMSFVRLRSRFLNFTGRHVLHCHILFHECLGMMQVVDVVQPSIGRVDREKRSGAARELVAEMNQRAFPGLADEFCEPDSIRVLRWGKPASA